MLHKVLLANNLFPSRNLPQRNRYDSRNPQYRFTNDRKPQQHETSIQDIRKKSKNVLLHVKTVFPFKLFPAHVIVDVHRVIVIEQTFLFADTIRSIPIGNIQYVRCDRSLFFGSLHIRSYGFSDRELLIKHLWTKDALRARRIIEGLVICYEDNVDPMSFEEKEISANLENIGRENAK